MSTFDYIFHRTGKALTLACGAFAALFLATSAYAAPRIANVFSIDGTYGVGDDILITVELDDIVTAGPTGKDKTEYPYIELDIDHSDGSKRIAYADVAGGFTDDYDADPSPNLYFIYTVQPGDYITDLDCKKFIPNGAVVTTESHGNVSRTTAMSLRVGADKEGSLAYNGDVAIQTLSFQSTGTQTYAETVSGKSSTEIVVTRTDAASYDTTFNVTFAPNDKPYVEVPASLTIPKDAANVVLPVSIQEASTAPIVITLHPQANRDAGGDLTATLTLGEIPAPTISLSANSPLVEGGASEPVTVSISKPSQTQTRLNLTVTPPGAIGLPNPTVTIPANQTSATFSIRPLDGDKNVQITATDPNGEYTAGTCDIAIENTIPVITSSTFGTQESPLEKTPEGGEGSTYLISWGATDVAADKPTLHATVSYGDGTPNGEFTGPNGTASHVYANAGTYAVTIIVSDKDGGSTFVSGSVTIKPANEVLIHEYKKDSANVYKGLPGLGRGTIDDNNTGTVRLPVSGDFDWAIKYSPALKSTTLLATPQTVDVGGKTYDSYFHVWQGELAKDNNGLGFAMGGSFVPIAPASALIMIAAGEQSSVEVGGVFSREFLPEDGCGDIDQDALPDRWEKMYSGTNDWERPGRMLNEDDDFLPRGAIPVTQNDGSVTVAYPLKDYAPAGIAFGNVWEVRGFHIGLNMNPNSTTTGAEVEPKDEPRYGSFDAAFVFTENDNRDFFGTDPTNPDSDGDGLTDGWEYYFWYIANFSAGDIVAERWDPTSVTTGIPIMKEEIAAAFHPLIPCKFGQNIEDFSDFDGDGLSDYEEMLLGTNPIHWDTDGDGMNDGWETMWGLDPLVNDADGNPDTDVMAYWADEEAGFELRHSDVRRKASEEKIFKNGYDPRVAWAEALRISRDQRPSSRPATGEDFRKALHIQGYSNWEEHYLGRWCIEQGITTEVPAITRDYMTQPTPKGTYRFVSTNSPLRSVTAFNPTATNRVSAGAAVAGVALLREAIGTHGYDTDGDGMPDGWELYCFVPADPTADPPEEYPDPFYKGNMWPTNPGDAGEDYDRDLLTNLQECHGTWLVRYYQAIDPDLKNANEAWPNKFWPTNPWDPDTDGDMIVDSEEMDLFNYTGASERGRIDNPENEETLELGYIRGGGLNPCTVDTDNDFLPDPWEAEFPGEGAWTADGTVEWTPGMDGTWPDAMLDYDKDGLANYQEYWTAAVPHFLYDLDNAIGNGVQNKDPMKYFVNSATVDDEGEALWLCAWDWNDWAVFPNPMATPPEPGFRYSYLPRVFKEGRNSNFPGYTSTDPRLPDTDFDEMDDYCEMFHCLNPVLSDLVDKVGDHNPDFKVIMEAIIAGGNYDFKKMPWLAGLAKADPDQDGIPNFEEALNPKQSAPQPSHTDPSPLWMSDMSYANSLVNGGYSLGAVPMFWVGERDVEGHTKAVHDVLDVMSEDFKMVEPSYMFDFEMNEGYDTDNDSRGDKSELIPGGASVTTDPLDAGSPGGHKSLYLDGESAARTIDGSRFGPDAFHSWTVQMWVKPDRVTHTDRQILIERPVFWLQKDTMPSFEMVRRTFRLGLEANGRPFVEFDNGGTEALTEKAVADITGVATTNWMHIAATMDGVEKRLSLYVDGELVASRSTAAIPYSGFFGGTNTPSRWAPIVIGAADANPRGAVDGSTDCYHGAQALPRSSSRVQKYWRDFGEPKLSQNFKGWIDEVSIWTGARTFHEIREDFTSHKRYRIADVIRIRENAVNQLNTMLMKRGFYASPYKRTFDEFYGNAHELIMETGAETKEVRIPPTLLCHYNFDTLPDHRSEPPEPVLAQGYEMLNGRPDDYTGVPFWEKSEHRSTIYKTADATPYLRLPFIKNTVSSVPKGYLMLERERIQELPESFDVLDLTTNDSMPFVEISSNVLAQVLTKAYFVAGSAADSVYWTHYEEGGVENAPGTVNTFPNSANPYGVSYKHGVDFEHQRSIQTIDQFYDPVTAPLFNDLLPLKGAYADGQVEKWDDADGSQSGTNRDTDGDGLPDWWELAHGMDPFNADQNGNGIIDFHDDFDHDGLSNGAEWASGTNPSDSDSDSDGVSDYFDEMKGFFFTDHDYTDDMWESLWDDRYASSGRYDEHLDLDGDGWNNWSEYLTTNNTARAGGYTRPDLSSEFPIPVINVELDYGDGYADVIFGSTVRYNYTKMYWEKWDGATKTWVDANWVFIAENGNEYYAGPENPPPSESIANLVVYVYHDPMMNGRPDALYVKGIEKPQDWPLSVILTSADLEYGHVKQGKNWFRAFIDIDKSSIDLAGAGGGVQWYTWTPGEATGVADGQWPNGIDIGYDVNNIRIPVSETTRSFARLSWADKLPVLVEGGTNGHQIAIVDIGTQRQVFERTMEWPRTDLNEGDIMAGKTANLGLGTIEGTYATPREFEWFLDGVSMGTFTNYYDELPVVPTLLAPQNDVIYDARIDFRFRLSPDATEFIFKLYRDTPDSEPVYTGRFQAPGRSNSSDGSYDLVNWRFPYSVGSQFPNGEIFSANGARYYWTIASVTPHERTQDGSVVSEFGSFNVLTSDKIGNNGNRGVMYVNVHYPMATNGACANNAQPLLRVQAFRNAAFSGTPEAEVACLLTSDKVAQLAVEGIPLTFSGLQPVDPASNAMSFGESLPLGHYYVRAFIDQSEDCERQNWESWGYHRDSGNDLKPFRPLAARATTLGNGQAVDIVVQDADTDNDKLPDSWEFAVAAGDPDAAGKFLAKLGYNDAGTLSSLSGMTAFGPYGDADGDGINDFDEWLATGTLPTAADSDGDGINDGLAHQLGFVSPMALKISSLDVANGDLTLVWNWDSANRKASVGAAPQGGSVPAKLASSADYVVEWNSDLSDPDGWKVFATTKSTSTAVGLESVQLTPEMKAAKSLFFRVRLLEK